MIPTEIFLVQSFNNDSAELPSEVLLEKLFGSHDRGVILSANHLRRWRLCPSFLGCASAEFKQA